MRLLIGPLRVGNRDVPKERYRIAFDLAVEILMRIGRRQQEKSTFPRRALHRRPVPRHTMLRVKQETVKQREPRHVPQPPRVTLGALPKVLNQFASPWLLWAIALSHTLVGHAIGHGGKDRAVVACHSHRVDKYV